jgi:thiamine biosynthesis protein ThiS
MTIVANGEKKDLSGSWTLEKFLKSCGWKPTQVVVEYNSMVIARGDAGKIELKNGDRLEIIVPVAGG